MNYAEAIEWIYGTQLHGIKLGLEPIRRLTAGLANSSKTPRFLHVAGTNGKGSVCAMLDSICRAQGFKTGLFTSPHLVNFRERIQLNGEFISESALTKGVAEIRQMVRDWEHAPTFFEIATALALAFFEREGAEIVVLETGMGGRLDATNVVEPAVSIITPIALDHQQWLGDTLGAIAGEKAGIIKPGTPAVSAPQAPEARAVLEQTAGQLNAPLEFIDAPLSHLPLGLAGSHQAWNAALAVRALQCAQIEVSASAIAQGLRDVQWPGRFQRLDERFVLDGAHNPAAAQRLTQTWSEIYGQEKATIVLGVLKDKDVRSVCESLLPIAARVLAIPVKSDRTTDPVELAGLFAELAPALPCAVYPDLASALCDAPASRVLITGSLFLVGEALVHFQHNPLPAQRSSQ